MRPYKEGLDYFPIDIDMDRDDKIYVIEAEHGLPGFAIIIKLLMEIYHQSYYIPWGEREKRVFSGKRKIDLDLLDKVVKTALVWGFFDLPMYEKHRILTSRGIQKRYLEATRKRNKNHTGEFLLPLDGETAVCASETGINSVETSEKQPSSTQRIVKNRIVKNIYGEAPVSAPETDDDPFDEKELGPSEPALPAIDKRPIYHLILNAFLSQNLDTEFNFKREGPHIKSLEKRALARDGPEEFVKAVIVTYWRLIHSEDKFWKKQPFLPSVLNSGGIWPRVMKELENMQEASLDAEAQQIIAGLWK